MTPTEALARIATHCDELETDAHPGRLVAQVRAVLAAVTPEPGGTLDRDQARAVLLGVGMPAVGSAGAPVVDDALLDRLAECVRPATIDRDQAAKVLWEAWDGGRCDEDPPGDAEIDRLAACVRPVAGVTLTPEEAEWAAFALRKVAPDFGAPFQRDVAEKLAARLEAAS